MVDAFEIPVFVVSRGSLARRRRKRKRDREVEKPLQILSMKRE